MAFPSPPPQRRTTDTKDRRYFGLAAAGLRELVLATLLLLPLTILFVTLALVLHWLAWLGALAAFLVWAEVIWFFRDPERAIPAEPTALLSPADGVITHIEEVAEPDFPGGRAVRISIFLSIFDVHINRLPRSGKVVAIRHFPGQYLDARHPECAARNEQLWLDIEEPSDPPRRLRVKQIAGAIARRIVCHVQVGDTVAAGARFGMIKFGSRTEVLVPLEPALEVVVKVGDRVFGGSTVLGRYLER